jgi:hypothetical protein
MEEYELADWGITPHMNNNERKQKSIQAYYFDKWYDKVKDVTFESYIYKVDTTDNDGHHSGMPDILPFEKSMVRWEHKSPKDSEFWTYVSTKKEVENLFYTSLRCKTNPGSFYCIREWINDIESEFRCFWNEKLVAVSAANDIEPPIQEILDYVKDLAKYIPYYRCVFDIAKTKRGMTLKIGKEYALIEFNSWESNSGSYLFSWVDDTEFFYRLPTDDSDVVFKWGETIKRVPFDQIPKTINLVGDKITDMSKIQIMKPNKPSNWLVTEKYIYIANDIYLGMFTHEFKPIYWRRGVFRFCNLQLCEDGSILAESFYTKDLVDKKTKSKLIKANGDEYPDPPLKYGFVGKLDGKFVFCRLMHDEGFRIVFY